MDISGAHRIAVLTRMTLAFVIASCVASAEDIPDAVLYDAGSEALQTWASIAGEKSKLVEYVKINPRSGIADDALLTLAQFARGRGEVNEAIGWLDELIMKYPNSVKFYIGYLNQSGKFYESPAHLLEYRRLLSGLPVRTSDCARTEKGRCLEAKGDIEGAKGAYKSVLQQRQDTTQLESNRVSAAYLLLQYECPHEKALEAMSRITLSEGDEKNAFAYARDLVRFYPGSKSAVSSVDNCISYCVTRKKELDRRYWATERALMLKEALDICGKAKLENPSVVGRLRQIEKENAPIGPR